MELLLLLVPASVIAWTSASVSETCSAVVSSVEAVSIVAVADLVGLINLVSLRLRNGMVDCIFPLTALRDSLKARANCTTV